MIATVFTPNGIVVATASYDSFYEYTEQEEDTLLSTINMVGLPHTFTFWGRYSLTFNVLNTFSADNSLLCHFEELEKRWTSMPLITEFMPYLKKLIVDNHIQIIGVLAAYAMDKNEVLTPYVYQILGESVRRINCDNEGNANYNCVYLEKTPHIGKLLQLTKIKNGDEWEAYPAVKLRCDLYSIKKAIDLCRFMLRTNHYVENINSALYGTPLKADISIITKEKTETLLMDI